MLALRAARRRPHAASATSGRRISEGGRPAAALAVDGAATRSRPCGEHEAPPGGADQLPGGGVGNRLRADASVDRGMPTFLATCRWLSPASISSRASLMRAMS